MGICLWALNHNIMIISLALSLISMHAWNGVQPFVLNTWVWTENGLVVSLSVLLSWMSHLKLIIPLRNPTRRFYYYISMILGFFFILSFTAVFFLSLDIFVCLCQRLASQLCCRRHHFIVINITVIVLDIIMFVLNYGTSSWTHRKMVCFHKKSPMIGTANDNIMTPDVNDSSEQQQQHHM